VQPRTDIAGTIGATADLVRAAGQRCVPVAADMSDDDDIANLASVTMSELGRVDILVNNAASQDERMYQSFWDMTAEAWRYQIAVNLTAAWVTLKAFAPIMRDQGDGGLVVNMTSALAGMPRNPNLPGHASTGAAYPVSKVALSRMTEDLAKELSPYGIAIVALHPGFVKTDIAELMAPVSGFDVSMASSSSAAPMAALEYLATHDALPHTGDVIFAPKFAKELGLLDA
jgi:NAD(P)-dependent dehydrogenase (short-subunit alcohol dehydrogenase family)